MSTARTRDTKLLATASSALDAPYCDSKLLMSILALVNFGEGEVAYIKPLTYEQVRSLFPYMTGLPKRKIYYSLHSANGIPIALTCTHVDAIEYADEADLDVTYLN